MSISEKENAILAIANLLKLGRPISSQGPEAETASNEEPQPVETTPSQAEEEKTES